MEEKTRTDGPALTRLTFTYDSQGRRVRKVVESFSSSSGISSLVTDHRFLYDDWNLVAEFEMNPLHPSSIILRTSYAWGYDLSATEQGAGGVGGLLLASQRNTEPSGTSQTTAGSPQGSAANQNGTRTTVPTYDGNGCITAYLEVITGQVMSRHEYDAFGNELSVDSLLVSQASSAKPQAPFKFSTKYTDPETALCYYGYRYMSPELGRWLNRDDLGEKGGLNLYWMVENDAANKVDIAGRTGWGSMTSVPPGMNPMTGGPLNPDPDPPAKRDCGKEYRECAARGIVVVLVFAGCLAPEKSALDKVIPGFGLGTAVVGSATGLAGLGYKWACDTQKAECDQWNTDNGF